MSKICPKCGSKTDAKTGRCPKCGYEPPRTKSKTLLKVIIGASAAVVVCVALILLVAFNIIRLPSFAKDEVKVGLSKGDTPAQGGGKTSQSSEAPDYIDPTGMSDDEIRDAVDEALRPDDPDAYFDGIGTVKEKISAGSSDKVTTESETRKLLNDRGFTDNIITTEYSMDGEYSDSSNISSYSSTAHPIYDMPYIDSQERTWVVSVTNGSVSALLFSYSVEHPDEPPVILSEADSLMGYDSSTNTFYEYTPKSDAASMRKVDKITADALNSFSL